ncbi:MAG: ethanolamine ammonia-lyase subunit EutC [Marinobacter sp.]|nr:ethanolamine ammonia-lyase subunit EutC [Marinobacter sp.]
MTDPSLTPPDWQGTTDNPWQHLRQYTAARIALGRTGVSLPTRELLAFQLAHAQARDAVHLPLDFTALTEQLTYLSQHHAVLPAQPPVQVHSQAVDRMTYLQRPDLGRCLDDTSRALLQQQQQPQQPEQAFDLAPVIADGLSAKAVADNAVPFITELAQQLASEKQPWSLAPITLVEQGRVAIADDIGDLLNARITLMMIGERPGLSSPDSLGLYLTFAPRPGLTDASRNCISNVRPAGLPHAQAASRAMYLLREARRLQLSGVGLKDRSGGALESVNANALEHKNKPDADNATQNFLLNRED